MFHSLKTSEKHLPHIRHLPLALIFILVFMGLTIGSASAMVPEKASVIIGVVDRYNKLDNVTIQIFDNSSGQAITSENTVNGTAQFSLQKGVYTLKVLKEGALIEVNQTAFNVTDTFQRRIIALQEKLYFLTIKAYDSSATHREYFFNETANAIQDSRMPNWLDNTTIRVELCAEPVAGGHTTGLIRSLPYQYIYQNEGSIRECFFWEYGVSKPDHANYNKHYGQWLHYNVKEGFFYCPQPLPEGNYTLKIWDGSHLLGKLPININQDLTITINVPYDAQEIANYEAVQQEYARKSYLKAIGVLDPADPRLTIHVIDASTTYGLPQTNVTCYYPVGLKAASALTNGTGWVFFNLMSANYTVITNAPNYAENKTILNLNTDTTITVALKDPPPPIVDLYYDDGQMDLFGSTSGGFAVRFDDPSPWLVESVEVYGCYEPYAAHSGTFYIRIWDANLATLFDKEYRCGDYFSYRWSGGWSWATFEIPDINVTGDFYVCVFPYYGDTGNLWIGGDTNSSISGRSYDASVNNGNHIYNQYSDRNWMIRCKIVTIAPGLYITSIYSSASQITLGQTFDLTVEGLNEWGNDRYYDALTVSFPAFTSPDDINRVTVLSHDFGPNLYLVKAGDTIYNKDGSTGTAKYLMVEGNIIWKLGEYHSLELRVCPKTTGEFPAYIRATSTSDVNPSWKFSDPSSSPYVDQQGYYVHQYTVNVIQGVSQLSDPSTTVKYGDSVIISTKLTDTLGNPLVGRAIEFHVADTYIGSGNSNQTGFASITYMANLAPGYYKLKVAFDGDSSYKSSSRTGTLVVNQETTQLSDPSASGTYGSSLSIGTYLKDDEGNPIGDRTVYFQYWRYPSWISLGSSITSSLGYASISIIASMTPGSYPLRVLFVEDSYYTSSTRSGTLTVTKASSTITCTVSPSSLTYGQSVTVSGLISPAHDSVSVTLTYTQPDGSTITRTVTTSSSGSFTDTYAPNRAGSWNVRTSWAGDSDHDGSSSSAASFSVIGASSTISCSVSPSQVTAGTSVSITGSISPAHSGATVIIYYSTDGSSWSTLTSVTSTPGGEYSATWTPSIGTYYIKASWSGDEDHYPAESPSATLTSKGLPSGGGGGGGGDLYCSISGFTPQEITILEGDSISEAITIKLYNMLGTDISTKVHVWITDPAGNTVNSTIISASVIFRQTKFLSVPLSFKPTTSGTYTIHAYAESPTIKPAGKTSEKTKPISISLTSKAPPPPAFVLPVEAIVAVGLIIAFIAGALWISMERRKKPLTALANASVKYRIPISEAHNLNSRL